MVATTRSMTRAPRPPNVPAAPPQRPQQQGPVQPPPVLPAVAVEPRVHLLERFSDRHYQAAKIGIDRVRRATQFLRLDVGLGNVPHDVSLEIQNASNIMAALLTDSPDAIGDLSQRDEEVVAVFAQVGLICVANALNHMPQNDRVPVLLPKARRSRVIGGATGVVVFEAQRTYQMRRPGNIGGRPDAMLMRQTGLARPNGNSYVPLCIMEIKRSGNRLLNTAKAACIIDAAVLGHRHQLQSVVGVVTNLRQWMFLRVEGGPTGTVHVSDVFDITFDPNRIPLRSPALAAGSVDHIVAVLVHLCLDRI